jgi:murein DD-endopeptidase MepM/ murein hydrolase activator NlpD
MKMSSDSYTIIIASNRGENAYKVVISHSWLKALSYLGFVALLLLTCALIDMASLSSKSEEHRVLVNENVALKEQNHFIEKRLSSALSDLDRIHSFNTKLSIITSRSNELMKLEKDMIQNVADTPSNEDDGSERAPASLEPLPADLPEDTEPRHEVNVERLNPFAPLSERVENALQEAQLREQELMETWGALSDRQSLLSAMPSIKPTHGYYSSLFGYRYDPINGRPLLHAGIDIASPWGTQVLAPADGVVSFAGYDGGYGNLVAIDHGYGITTRFGHNSRLFVHQGQRVHRWDVISAVGSTGHSTGAHVHYEVRIHGLPVNPANYILQEN